MPRAWAEPQLRRMVESIRHESFYDSGIHVDESLGVYSGWTVRKNSFATPVPVCNERDDVSLVFSGEEFPEPGTAKRLKEKGHSLPLDGPSYLVHLYEEDQTFPAGLNGRFHGLLIDRSKGTITLFNDRYGLQRLYYHQSKEAFYFAAEAKAILAVRPELRRVDSRGMGEFISCGCVMENRTLFEGISVLPPASAWVFRAASLSQKNSYFTPQEWENQPRVDSETYYQQLKEIYSRKLSQYFESHERMGMSLTGGLDTRMIMAWQQAPKGALPCYSFGGTYHECQDVSVARKVATICGQSHQVIPLDQQFLSQFARYAERTVFLSDGCAEINRASDLYANVCAREIAPMRMTGNYGSEVLRRTMPRTPNAPTPAFKPVDPMPGLFRDNDLVQAVFRAPQAALVNNDFCLRLIGDGNPALRAIRSDRGLAGNGNHTLASITRAYLEFTFKAEYAYDYGMPQRLAQIDHAFSALHFERLFLGRHKFAHYRVWYRDPLANYVREMLLDPRTLSRPYLDKKMVEMIVAGHLKGNRNYTTEIHKLLTLELLHRLFVDVH
jgi:asparagine synthase (glutamine-hydrolysing)